VLQLGLFGAEAAAVHSPALFVATVERRAIEQLQLLLPSSSAQLRSPFLAVGHC
jgi:hypothetical protein